MSKWRPHRVRSLAVGAALLGLLAACVPVSSDRVWERVREAGVLRVGMDASFPPFEAVAADGTLFGFDVDLARELAQRLGVEAQVVANLPYDGLDGALIAGQVDAVVSAYVVNPARMADLAYSAPYFDAGQVLVAREREAAPEMMSDLGGHSLAVEFGTRGDLEARKWDRRLPGLRTERFQTAAEALAAVAGGQADVALVDHVSALACAESGLIIVGEPVVSEPCAVAVHRDSRYLLRAIDEALAEMRVDGTLDALVTEWLAGGL